MTKASKLPKVVLASASRPRAGLLQAAKVPVKFEPASIDEAAVKSSFRARSDSADEVAGALAEMKAMQVSLNHPGALVIGADQMLECGNTWFDKPADRGHARAQLMALSGRTHVLIAAVCVVRDSEVLWRHTEHARMTMRRLSSAFLDEYLERLAADEVCQSVGAYQLENAGAQLFSKIDGDHFTILGLPLLPLLDFLRGQGVIME